MLSPDYVERISGATRAWAGRFMGMIHSIASSGRDPMQEVAKFLREQFSQVPMLAADGSFVQYDKTAPILELPHRERERERERENYAHTGCLVPWAWG